MPKNVYDGTEEGESEGVGRIFLEKVLHEETKTLAKKVLPTGATLLKVNEN